MSEIKPPEKELDVGMLKYLSKTPGISGVLKDKEEDFIVHEITEEGLIVGVSEFPKPDMTPGQYTHFSLEKRGWETHRALAEIGKRLNISRKRFSFSGTKDKRAITHQRVAVYKIPVERLANLMIKDIKLTDIGYSDENLGLGSLWGNKFLINVKDTKAEEGQVQRLVDELSCGVPNFFGLQRFGETRQINQRIGVHFLKGDYESAFWEYICAPSGNPEVDELRKKLLETKDLRGSVNLFPKHMGYEKAIINRLIEKPGDFQGAFNALPETISRFFVHSLQSYVFNLSLSRCIIDENWVERLPLVGSETKPDPITQQVLEQLGISPEDFGKRELGGLRSKGTVRKAFIEVKNLIFKEGHEGLHLEFELEKGSYATVVMRELMKD